MGNDRSRDFKKEKKNKKKEGKYPPKLCFCSLSLQRREGACSDGSSQMESLLHHYPRACPADSFLVQGIAKTWGIFFQCLPGVCDPAKGMSGLYFPDTVRQQQKWWVF